MAKRIFLFLALNILVVNLLVAQRELTGMGVRSEVLEVKNGRKHFVHVVKPGETLYSISKTYHIPIRDIASVNNNMLLKLKSGQKVYIPTKPVSPEDRGARYYFFFVAEEDMSLYKASQHYRFNIDDFLKLNPKAKTGIRRGEIIKVPKERTVIEEQISKDSLVKVDPTIDIKIKAPCRDFIYDKEQHTFKVAMLLPLFLERNERVIEMSSDDLYRAKFDPRTSRFIEYIQGVLMAADQLRKEGLNVELSIYDTKNDSTRIDRLLQLGTVDEVDLVVGPVYSKHYLTVSNYLKGKEINLVSPLSRNTRLISNNHHSYLLTPSDETLFKALSHFVAKEKAGNILLVHNGTRKELSHAGVFKNQLEIELAKDSMFFTPKFKMINYKLGGTRAIEQQMDSVLKNLIIIPSSDEVFVTDIVAKVNVISLRYPTLLIGREIWENYKNLSLSNLHNLRLHYATNSYINYEDPRVLRFIQNYRFMFKAEPTSFAFQGHDGFLFFGQALKRYGKSFNYCLGADGIVPNKSGLSSEWNFEQLDEYSGYENKTAYIVQYKKGVDVIVHRVVMRTGEEIQETQITKEEEVQEEQE